MLVKSGYLKQPSLENITPTLDIDFTRIGSGDAPWDDRLTFYRDSPATYIDANGTRQSVSGHTPRFDFDANGNCLGLLVEEKRGNYLLNSLVPATQSRTLSSGTYLLWMDGTGNVTISVGATGTATQDTPLKFVLYSTQSVTFTVNGIVTAFQCEKPSNGTDLDYPFTTSLIVTPAGSSDIRTQDLISFNNLDWFNNSEGVMIAEVMLPHQMEDSMRIWHMTDGNSDTTIEILYHGQPTPRANIEDNGVSSFDSRLDILPENTPVNQVQKYALGFKENDFIFAVNGQTIETDNVGLLPIINSGYIGATAGESYGFSGYIRRLTFWNVKLDNNTIVQMTT